MTDQEIIDKVESWNWNLSIFEIYDEVKEMSMYHYSGYGGGNESSHSNLSRLLTHAYDFFKCDPMIKELASFLGAEITEKKELTKAS